MSSRSSITSALVEKLKGIDGTNNSNLYNNAFALNKFWTETNDFPCVYVVPGAETREYLPGGFKWGFINITIKAYVKGETPIQDLENLLEDIETIIDANRILEYATGKETTEIEIKSIVTDEGLLVPYGIAEIVLTVQYQIMT